MMTREQFVRQISQEQAALRRFLTALCCGNSTTADDMAQDTLLKAYMQLPQYDERGRFASWLMKIAYRVFIDNRRKLKSHAEEPIVSAKIIQDAQQTDNTFRYQALYIALEALSEKSADNNAVTLHARLSGEGNSRNNRCHGECRQEATLAGSRRT